MKSSRISDCLQVDKDGTIRNLKYKNLEDLELKRKDIEIYSAANERKFVDAGRFIIT